MSSRKLQESEYESFFNSLSKAMQGEPSEIEVMAVSIMAREMTEWIPFYGISYDPAEKTVSIIYEYIDHRIMKPAEIYVDETDQGVQSIVINGGDGYTHRITFKHPVTV
jgi:hypothetical protein